MKKKTYSLAASLLLAAAAAGKDPLQFSGYYKNYAAWDERSRWEDVQRVRLKMDARPSADWDLRVHYELRLELRDKRSPLPGGVDPPVRFMDLEKTLHEKTEEEWSHQVDRLRLRIQTAQHEWRIGRQAVSWGSGLVWNPTDVFAGFAPLEIDRDDKPGVDVLRWTWTLSGDTSIDVVFQPGDADASWQMSEDESALAVRLFGRLGEYDLALMVGQIEQDRVWGGDFSGYLADAGLRGEYMQTFAEDGEGPDFFRGLLGIDYSFAAPCDPYISLEYFYNGPGSSNPDRYLSLLSSESVQRAFERGNAFNFGRHYLGLVNRVTLTALTGISAATLINLEDHSLRTLASVTWSVRQQVDLQLGFNAGWGADNGEFQQLIHPEAGAVSRDDFAFGYLKVYF